MRANRAPGPSTGALYRGRTPRPCTGALHRAVHRSFAPEPSTGAVHRGRAPELCNETVHRNREPKRSTGALHRRFSPELCTGAVHRVRGRIAGPVGAGATGRVPASPRFGGAGRAPGKQKPNVNRSPATGPGSPPPGTAGPGPFPGADVGGPPAPPPSPPPGASALRRRISGTRPRCRRLRVTAEGPRIAPAGTHGDPSRSPPAPLFFFPGETRPFPGGCSGRSRRKRLRSSAGNGGHRGPARPREVGGPRRPRSAAAAQPVPVLRRPFPRTGPGTSGPRRSRSPFPSPGPVRLAARPAPTPNLRRFSPKAAGLWGVGATGLSREESWGSVPASPVLPRRTPPPAGNRLPAIPVAAGAWSPSPSLPGARGRRVVMSPCEGNGK